MEATRKTKLSVWVTALALIMACAPSLATPVVPTLDPGAVNTFIAQTVNAAGTQTAASMPSLTPSPTITPVVNTDTPSPTPTATVIFVLSTPTPLVIPTFTAVSGGGGGGSGFSDQNYSCQVTRIVPPNGSSFEPRDDFDAIWTVRNNGQKNWDRNSVDYIYSSGAKIHKISGYDLDENVRVGNSIDLGVDMQAPKDPGTYTTTWNMRSGNKTFCNLNLTIVVDD